VGSRAGLNGCGKSRHYRDSIPGLSSPQRVEIHIAVAPQIEIQLTPSTTFPAKEYIHTISILLIYEMHKNTIFKIIAYISPDLSHIVPDS
jgi:hypothetical protein